MWTLNQFKEANINNDLLVTASILTKRGLSVFAPVHKDGAVTLSQALALAFGASKRYPSDGFSENLNRIPPFNRRRFIMCWDAIELEVENDIDSWAADVGQEEVIRRITALAKIIELS